MKQHLTEYDKLVQKNQIIRLPTSLPLSNGVYYQPAKERQLEQGELVQKGDRVYLSPRTVIDMPIEEEKLGLRVTGGAVVVRQLDKEWYYEI